MSENRSAKSHSDVSDLSEHLTLNHLREWRECGPAPERHTIRVLSIFTHSSDSHLSASECFTAWQNHFVRLSERIMSEAWGSLILHSDHSGELSASECSAFPKSTTLNHGFVILKG